MPSLRTAAVVSALVLTTAAAAIAAPASGGINWVDDLATAKAASDRTGKPMLIVFEAGYCGYCKRLKGEVFANPQVSRYIAEGFVPVRINLDDASNQRAAQILEVQTLPCSVVLNSDADQLARIRGFKDAKPYFQELAAARKLQSRIASR